MNTHVTVSDIRHDFVNTHTIVSGIREDVAKIREGIGGQVQPVQTRSATSTTKKSRILHLHLAHLESHLLHHRGPVSGVTS